MKPSSPTKQNAMPPNPGDLIDFLYQIGSNIHVIHLANLMWEKEEEMCFVRDDGLIRFWDKELASIRQSTRKGLADLKHDIDELDISQPDFLPAFGRTTARVGVSLLKQMEQLQENIYHRWKPQLPENAFFPALELFFREGEIKRFQDILKSLRRRMIRPFRAMQSNLKKESKALPADSSIHDISEKYRKEYQLETTHTIQAAEHILNFILSFYERKWSLLLSPEKGQEVWIQK